MKLNIKKILKSIIIVIVISLSIFPIIYLLITSVKPAGLLFAYPPRFIFKLDIRHYKEVLINSGYYKNYINSFITAGGGTIGSLLLGSLASFSFMELWKSKTIKYLFFFIIFGKTFVPATSFIPIYLAASYLNLLDTRLILILIFIAFRLPLAVLILTTFFQKVPEAIRESAEMDGCSTFGKLFYIVLPLSAPGLVAAGTLIFMYNWNAFLFPLVLTSVKAPTATVALSIYKGSESALHWGQLSTLGFCMTIPVLLFAIFLHKYMVQGLVAGALKE